MSRPLLAITLGDPNGIGPEVVLKAARDPRARSVTRLVAVGSAVVLRDQAERLGLGPVATVASPSDTVPEGTLAVWDAFADLPASYAWGETTIAGGHQAVQAVTAAIEACVQGDVDGMVTAPLSKEAINRAGYSFPGHTEFLQEQTDTETVVMVLASDLPTGALRVALVTIHVPVSAVAELVTSDRIVEVARTLEAALRTDLGIESPTLAVLGLNPHAGDGGVLGREEIEILGPALERLRQLEVAVEGPFPADAFFGRASWARCDAVLAMYHDQGLAPFKALAMGGGVNVTFGLPIVRTSPDHGTGFDIAGQGIADPGSMVEAIRLAATMAQRRAGVLA
ncbi:MAG: 4-hydroxythreonine-4-phosphate dehydrogenase PdxA [Rubricoccaceae bacterium]